MLTESINERKKQKNDKVQSYLLYLLNHKHKIIQFLAINFSCLCLTALVIKIIDFSKRKRNK